MGLEKFVQKPVWAKSDDNGENELDLRQIDKSTEIYTDEEGKRWATKTRLVSFFRVGWDEIDSRASGKTTIQGKGTDGRKITLYNIDEFEPEIGGKNDLPSVDSETQMYVDSNGKQWITATKIAEILVTSTDTIKRRAELEEKKAGIVRGHEVALYPLDIFSEDINRNAQLPRADQRTGIYIDEQGRKWAPMKTIAKKLRAHSQTLMRNFSTEESKLVIDRKFHPRAFYCIDILEKKWLERQVQPRVDESTGLYTDPRGKKWGSIRRLAELLEMHRNSKLFQSLFIDVSPISGLGTDGVSLELYPVDIVTEKLAHYKATHPQIDKKTGVYSDLEGRKWAPASMLAREFHITQSTVHNKLKNLESTEIPTEKRGGAGKVRVYRLETAEEELRKYLLPEIDETTGVYTDAQGREWAPITILPNILSISKHTIRPFLSGKDKIEGKGKNGQIIELYAVDQFEKRHILKSEKDYSVSDKLLHDFFRSDKEQREFRELVGLFGAAQNLDVLYALKPEFKNIPPERLKGMMAEYLGSYLLTPMPFEVENLEKALIYLKNDSLREGLREVIKNDALHKCLAIRKLNPEISEQDLFQNYIDDLRKKTQGFNSAPELHQTINDIEQYYRSVFEDFRKPRIKMVDSLKEGRKFPDLYQKINVKELSDKKRLLIADEMGVGKSASAILAKEELGVKTALIVAPSNVEDTWRSYLSDAIGEDGKQIGYFRPGFQPRVLIIQNQKDLEKIKQGAYDYLFISHEKLSEKNYIESLTRNGFDMLVVDEVHELKNVTEGKRSAALLELADQIQGDNQYLALLSGTPVPNKVEDVAILLKLLHSEKFKDITAKQMIPQIIHGDLADLRTLLVPRMQMKSLAENVEMPKLIEKIVTVPLSRTEEQIYQVLLDEDELTSVEKMHALRQFLINPALLRISPETRCSKLDALQGELTEAFGQHDKVIVFVNDYISDVIRDENSIIERLKLPADVAIKTVHGGNRHERQATQDAFNRKEGKMLLFVSGGTASVGVDYSGADHLIFYNEPWTKADKDQQQARPYRPGLTHDLTSVTLLTENTIDEGIHRYIAAKYQAIEKLVKGIPVTEFEEDLLTRSENAPDPNLEVNAELAKYYFSVFDKMNRIFGSVKRIGEKRFLEYLDKNGKEYADYYQALGGRSYQANAGRVCAALIQEMSKEQRTNIKPRILDLGSGPEMLRKHAQERLQPDIVSVDLNPEHFLDKSDRGNAVAASYSRLPFATDTFDYVNMSFALHHTRFAPSRGEFETAQALAELARVLKVKGRGVINEMYSLRLKDESKLRDIVPHFGLRVVEEYSGEAKTGDTYLSRVITLEKTGEALEDAESVIKKLPREVHDGLKFVDTKNRLKDKRRIITEFSLGSKNVPIALNTHDRMMREQEQNVLSQGEKLKGLYGSIESIPQKTLDETRFIRFRIGKRYALFKEEGGSVIVVK